MPWYHPLGFVFCTLLFIFPFLSTPLSMGCCLLLLSIMMAVTGASMYCHLWLSYTLVLVFLGGILVIFIYVALVASNEQFSLTLKPLALLLLSAPSFLLWTHELAPMNENERFMDFSFQSLNWLNKIYSNEQYLFTLFLVLYLFLTLIVVVNNTKTTKMTLRSF